MYLHCPRRGRSQWRGACCLCATCSWTTFGLATALAATTNLQKQLHWGDSRAEPNLHAWPFLSPSCGARLSGSVHSNSRNCLAYCRAARRPFCCFTPMAAFFKKGENSRSNIALTLSCKRSQTCTTESKMQVHTAIMATKGSRCWTALTDSSPRRFVAFGSPLESPGSGKC